MAEAFAAWDVDVHLFRRPTPVLPPFGEAVAERVRTRPAARDVDCPLDTALEALEDEDGDEGEGDGDGRLDALVRADGTRTAVDAALVGVDVDVGVGVGVRPDVGPVADAVDLHDSGAVAIDDYGRTSAPDVYATGDCAAMPHAMTGDLEWAPLGPAANAPAGPSGVERPTSSHADRRWIHSPVRTA